jgi:cytochrome c nitrite reductase small subunit
MIRRLIPSRRGATWAGLLVSGLAGAVLGLGGYTFWYGEGGSYLSDNPNTCANCHIMRDHLDSWQKASHHAHATCLDCHVPHDFVGKWLTEADNGFWHSYAFTTQDFREPIRIKPRNSAVLQANCVGCHGDLVHNITAHGPASPAENNCVRCHAAVGHGPSR